MALHTWLLTIAKECPPSLNPHPLLLLVTFRFRLKEKKKWLAKSFKQRNKQGRQRNKQRRWRNNLLWQTQNFARWRMTWGWWRSNLSRWWTDNVVIFHWYKSGSPHYAEDDVHHPFSWPSQPQYVSFITIKYFLTYISNFIFLIIIIEIIFIFITGSFQHMI